MALTLRDLLPGEPHPNEGLTLKEALEPTEWVRYLDPLDGFTARMPGDGPHPLDDQAPNPFPGKGLQELQPLLRSGTLDPDTERQVRRYVAKMLHYMGAFDGDGAYLRQGHALAVSTEQKYADVDTVQYPGALRRADRFEDFSWK